MPYVAVTHYIPFAYLAGRAGLIYQMSTRQELAYWLEGFADRIREVMG